MKQNQKFEEEPDARQESIGFIELRSDGEARFQAAVTAAAKSGPMHRLAKR
jgi:hypothetical protein